MAVIVITSCLMLAVDQTADASQWIKSFASTYTYYLPDAVQQTSDGGFILLGNKLPKNPWITKLDKAGNVIWGKLVEQYGWAVSVRQVADGGYIIGLRGNHQTVLKLDADGVIEWEEAYDATGERIMVDVVPTRDGGYIVAMQFDKYATDRYKVVLIKTDSTGNILWQHGYGQPSVSVSPVAVRQTTDGGYIVAAISCALPPIPTSSCRGLALKLDTAGEIEWQKQYVSSDQTMFYSIEPTVDEGYIAVGSIRNVGAGSNDAWVVKLGKRGSVQWQKTYGGTGLEEAYAVQEGTNSTYVVGGVSQSFGENHMSAPWIFQIDATGGIQRQFTYGDGIHSGTVNGIARTTDGSFVASGNAGPTLLLMKTDERGKVLGCNLSKRSHAIVTDSKAEVRDADLRISRSEMVASPAVLNLQDTAESSAEICAGVALLNPNGGETIAAGSSYLIDWLPHPDAATHKLKYSTNNGLTWRTLVRDYSLADTYDWSVAAPANNKAGCLVKVLGYDSAGKLVGTDVSDAPFAIEVVRLLTPAAGGQVLTSGSHAGVTWTTNATTRPVVRSELYLTKDALAEQPVWEPVVSIKGNPGSYDWEVPAVRKMKSNCKLKIVLRDKQGAVVGSDTSDVTFTIQP